VSIAPNGNTPQSIQPSGPVLDLPTPEGWKAELSWVVGYILKCPKTVTHPGTNCSQRRATTLIWHYELTTSRSDAQTHIRLPLNTSNFQVPTFAEFQHPAAMATECSCRCQTNMVKRASSSNNTNYRIVHFVGKCV